MIYFVTTGHGHCKIGWTQSPASMPRRMQALQNGNCYRLTLEATCPGDYEQEQHLHRHFAEFRVVGEWFRESPEIRALIDTVKMRGEIPESLARAGHQYVSNADRYIQHYLRTAPRWVGEPRAG